MESGIRILAEGLKFPEGPVAMPDGAIVLVEIERETISRVAADGTGRPNDSMFRAAMCTTSPDWSPIVAVSVVAPMRYLTNESGRLATR